jgi:hypothetical protein
MGYVWMRSALLVLAMLAGPLTGVARAEGRSLCRQPRRGGDARLPHRGDDAVAIGA